MAPRRPIRRTATTSEAKPSIRLPGTDTGPLNPTLYAMLVHHFGEVHIVSPGRELVWTPDRRVWQRGEEYRINCPFCLDARKRLYISYLWGVWDEATQSKNLFLCRCFNEECMSDPGKPGALHKSVYSGSSRGRDGKIATKPGYAKPTGQEACELPGETISLAELSRTDPWHPAITYLQSRNFDPVALSEEYGAVYCLNSRYGLAEDRIIVPIYVRDQLRGWQARYPGDDVYGLSFKEAGVPKYWTCPGTKVGSLVYNADKAATHRTIVVVEGPTDVWRLGAPAAALLGKKANQDKVIALRDAVKRAGAEPHERSIVILLDTDPSAKHLERTPDHPIEKAAAEFVQIFPKVSRVYLPSGTDPGSLSLEFLRDTIYRDKEARKM